MFRSPTNMFSAQPRRSESFSSRQRDPRDRAGKASFSKKRTSFRAGATSSSRQQRMVEELAAHAAEPQTSPSLNSAIVTILVGPEERVFAAHEEILANSPYLAELCHQQFYESKKKIRLPDDTPEIFSCVLEYLYKGDYFPRLSYDKHRHSWNLETQTPMSPASLDSSSSSATVVDFVTRSGQVQRVLKDTVIYCSAYRHGLPELQALALRKQGLQSGIPCSTILSSMRYAYDNTPDSDSRLRAHYLALVIRSRNTFKRSGTMQNEMERGGRMFFDLFVAMVNHLDDVQSTGGAGSSGLRRISN